MFEIEYKGGNGVLLSTKKATIVADPNLSVIGLKNLPVKEAIEVATEPRFAVNSDDAKLVIEVKAVLHRSSPVAPRHAGALIGGLVTRASSNIL